MIAVVAVGSLFFSPSPSPSPSLDRPTAAPCLFRCSSCNVALHDSLSTLWFLSLQSRESSARTVVSVLVRSEKLLVTSRRRAHDDDIDDNARPLSCSLLVPVPELEPERALASFERLEASARYSVHDASALRLEQDRKLVTFEVRGRVRASARARKSTTDARGQNKGARQRAQS